MRVAILALLLGCSTPAAQDEPMSKKPPTPTPTPAPTPTPSPTPSARTSTSAPVPVLTSASELDLFVGQTVILRGTLTRTKIPTILGVDVEGPAPDALAEKMAEATGTLEREVVTQEELDAQIAKMGQFANRGAGTFYRLVRPGGGGLATPRPAP